MLAADLLPRLHAAGHTVTAAGRADLDITDAAACERAVARHDVVVNLAAWTAVDDAESHEREAFAANAFGAANLARASSAADARMVQLSTDYVFDGDAMAPYAEDSPTGPRSAYGRTKLAGEWAVRTLCPDSWVVRTAWLYGAGGRSFVGTMARLASGDGPVDVVDDQRGQPTWTGDLADQLVRLIASQAPFGTYHGTASGDASWYDLARAVFAGLGHDVARVRPTTSAAFVRPAPRPAYSVLGHDRWARAGLPTLRDWRTALDEALPLIG
ncbi:dTDP-4-dehydrorhamnose reductase [Luteipulveratus halotolerans]|uniref:dTDP-4-dehydrorhamnose reductase n=2 Tax=Luteipulveratus halotolerans TaxID=1631356 RepID=A0A0L6CNR4_9MICO|nr:dTDP-4-dehydrorhamnose reductase [Luteipulveratus halotolerans]